jgi:hypothetical protein
VHVCGAVKEGQTPRPLPPWLREASYRSVQGEGSTGARTLASGLEKVLDPRYASEAEFQAAKGAQLKASLKIIGFTQGKTVAVARQECIAYGNAYRGQVVRAAMMKATKTLSQQQTTGEVHCECTSYDPLKCMCTCFCHCLELPMQPVCYDCAWLSLTALSTVTCNLWL